MPAPPQSARELSATDTLLLRLERSPELRSTILQVALLSHPPDRERFRRRVLEGIDRVPRFREVPVWSPVAGVAPTWRPASEFDVDYHLQFVRLPDGSGLRELLDYAARLSLHPFDTARPLWESHIVEGLADGRAAAIQKIHHSLGDGISLLDVVLVFVDIEPDPAPAAPVAAPPVLADVSTLQRLIGSARNDAATIARFARRAPGMLVDACAHPLDTTASAVSFGRSLARVTAPGSGALSPLMRDRSLGARFDALAVPMPEMKAAAHRVNAKLNTAFVAGIAGGLARYHASHAVDAPALRFAMPVSTREDTGLGNQFAPARFVLPIDAADPLVRMEIVRDVTTAQRTEQALSFTGSAARLLNVVPAGWLAPMVSAVGRRVDVVASSVPGTPIPLYVAGSASLQNFGFSPHAGAALNVTMISHLDELHLAINSDPAAIPDADLLIACLQDSFDELVKLA